jgi:hypothetical protein
MVLSVLAPGISTGFDRYLAYPPPHSGRIFNQDPWAKVNRNSRDVSTGSWRTIFKRHCQKLDFSASRHRSHFGHGVYLSIALA